VNSNFNTLSNSILALSNTVNANFNTLSNSVLALSNTVNANFTTLSNSIGTLTTTVNSNFQSLSNSISNISTIVNNNYTTLTQSITSVGNSNNDALIALSNQIISVNMPSTVQGLGRSGYISSLINVPSVSTQQFVASSIGVNTNPATGFIVDINGPTQSATYYSSVNANPGTFTPSGYGVFYDFTVGTTPTPTIILNPNPIINKGKYNVFRNNTGNLFTINVTLNDVVGITATVSVANQQGVTFMVADTNRYALF
jgi:hypothetical protein